MKTLKQILDKWEKKVSPILKEDLETGTIDLCDWVMANGIPRGSKNKKKDLT